MPNTLIQPYLFFGGRCEEALEFYRTALGAQVDFLMLYKDSPEPPPPGMLQPGFENKVMHTTFRIGGSTLMASDGCHEGSGFDGFNLSLAVPTEAEADRAFVALADGVQVQKEGEVSTFANGPRLPSDVTHQHDAPASDRSGKTTRWRVVLVSPPQGTAI
jgi:PhnB protein